MRHAALSLALVAAAVVVAPAAAASAPAPTSAASPGVEVFTSIDRRALAVGGYLLLDVELLRAGDDAGPLREALDGVRLPETDAFDLVRAPAASAKVTDGVVEAQRRFVLRARRAGAAAVPAPRVELDGRELAAPTHAVRVFEAPPREAFASVVPIVAQGREGETTFRRTGTAFLAAPDALVTAYHVVAGANRVLVRLPSGRTVRLRRVLALDPARDVAVLHIDPRHAEGLPVLAFAPDGDASPDAVAFTAGWPLLRASDDGFDRAQATTAAVRHADLGAGDVALRVSSNGVRPGDSGGPMLDAQGRVLGVVVSGRATSGEPDLLREDLCLAADPRPALRSRVPRPVQLTSALRAAERHVPSAQAYDAVAALVGPVRQPARASHERERLLDALRRSPHDPVLQFLAGTALDALGDDDEALVAFAGAHRGGFFPAAYALAHHRLAAGEIRAAGELFAEVRRSAPYARLGAMGLARTRVADGRYGEAEAAVREVLAHEPRFAPALYLLGYIRIAQGRTDDARALAVRLRSRPEWAGSLRFILDNPGMHPEALRPLPRQPLGRLPAFTAELPAPPRR